VVSEQTLVHTVQCHADRLHARCKLAEVTLACPTGAHSPSATAMME